MVLKLETVSQDIDQWIQNFVEVPHPALGGWPPCPYARRARIDQDFEVRIGVDLGADLAELSRTGISKSVVILVYEAGRYSAEQFNQTIDDLNQQFLVRKDLLALADHPRDEEIVNGLKMNQGTYALALVQSLSDLDQKAQAMANKGFYQTWPEEYLTELFKHRQDPRN